jgi:LuxR family maltose regulon positive regulatory protein
MEALRFTETEAGEFFTSSMGVELSRDEVATLEERTEGWIAGLQMAGLSMRGIADPAPFIRSFGGSNRYILDYLLEEIFDRQSPEIRRLLTACSLLDFFCGELCDELTESRGCAALLKDLYKENLFLVSLDEECRYYRFHHLFADLLRHRLFRENAETAVRELHRRAGSWLARNGTVGEAIKHLIAGQDYARAAELIIARFSITIEMGLFPSFIEWINALPDELVKGWPELLVVKLFVFSLSRIIIDESLILSELEDALSAIKEEARKLKIESSISALMCILCDKRGELQEASHYADLILERNPSPDAFTRAVVSSARIKAFRSTGNWAESDRIYSEYCPAAQHEASPWFMMVVACEHLVSLMLRGRMNAAWQLCEDLIAFAQERGALSYPIVAKVYACMAEIQRERNDLEGASRSTRDSLALVELVKYSSDLIACYLLYAGISRAKGDLETSGEWIRKADDLMKAGGAYSFYGALISLERARLIYARGAIEEIDAWIEAGNGQNNGEPFLRLRFDIETARLRLLRSRILPLEVEAVRSLLASRAVEAEKAGRLRELTEIQAVNAMMSAQGFDRKRAFAELEKALSIAEPEGFARVFLDQGRAIEELLQTGIADREFKEEGVLEYATALLAAAKP